MRFWWREIAGWVLLVIGLSVFGLVIFFLSRGQVYQTVTMTVIAVFIFRGGIHLLKVAVAARICEEAAAKLRQPPPLASRGNRGKLTA